jgi:superfamily II DNA helicase RecQ
MAFAFFLIPADANSALAAELNSFLTSHRILRVGREWCGHGVGGSWAFCIEYVAGDVGGEDLRARGGKRVDYREILPPAEFQVYSRLRELRRTLSDRDGVAAFVLFTNEQLAEMVRKGCRTLDDLKGIAGIGEARVAKYGADVLSVMNSGRAEV